MRAVRADDRARRAVRRGGADHRRARHRQGSRRRLLHALSDARAQAAGDDERRRAVGGRRRVRAVRPREGRVHRRARPIASAASSWRTRARCSSTRSRTCRSGCSRSCCACCRPAKCSRSDRRACVTSTCASCRRPTPISAPRSPPAAFAKTSCTGSTPSSSICRRCANGARTSGRWPSTTCARYAARYREASRGLRAGRARGARAHLWPGNVRELGHGVERAVLMAEPGADVLADQISRSVCALALASRSLGELDEMTLETSRRSSSRRCSRGTAATCARRPSSSA